MKFLRSISVLSAFIFATVASADLTELDSPALDRPYPRQAPIVDDGQLFSIENIFRFAPPLPSKSDLGPMFEIMTPVRSQDGRGTCSIFSATAILESLLVREFGWSTVTTDLSEQWLAYHASHYNRSEGSSAYTNFNLLKKFGDAYEKDMPYNGTTWEGADLTTIPLAMERCGHLSGSEQEVCAIAQRQGGLMYVSDEQLSTPGSRYYDPEFHAARNRAESFKYRYLSNMGTSYYISSVSMVKRLLAAGIPVILELDFYYGAWNHGRADTYGIGRDAGQFARGEVGYPAQGSLDRQISEENPAGHSILLVGYDDNAITVTRQRMEDGSVKEFKYKGVYYFKNSWGVTRFGTAMELNGSTPGYGSITYKYAHEFGGFYQFPIHGNEQ